MSHTFEPNYLSAVNDLISRRDILAEVPREGMYWGLGRTTTLLMAVAYNLKKRLKRRSYRPRSLAVAQPQPLLAVNRRVSRQCRRSEAPTRTLAKPLTRKWTA